MDTGKKTKTKKKTSNTPNAVKKSVQEKIEVTAKPEDLCGNYSNFAVFRHNKREFVADFVWRMDNTNLLVSRIITSPQHAKALHRALGKNLQNYEKQYGEITED